MSLVHFVPRPANLVTRELAGLWFVFTNLAIAKLFCRSFVAASVDNSRIVVIAVV